FARGRTRAGRRALRPLNPQTELPRASHVMVEAARGGAGGDLGPGCSTRNLKALRLRCGFERQLWCSDSPGLLVIDPGVKSGTGILSLETRGFEIRIGRR